MGPLSGLVVADFSRVVAGPLAAMTLGDLGARVIKVERPGIGDDTRGWGPPWRRPDSGVAEHAAPESTYFLSINRNKESIELDLDAPDDRELALGLVARADILVENFRPGAMDRFGLGWEACSALNHRLVYCSIEGYGDTPAATPLAGYDLLAQAASGLMSITGDTDGRPLKTGVAIVDVLTALNATVGVLAAVEARHRTGRGDHIRVSLFDAAMSALINQASAALIAGVAPARVGNAHPSIAPYAVYAAADRQFVLACGTDAQFARACDVIGRPELATEARFGSNSRRVTNRDDLDSILERSLRGRDAADWVSEFTRAAVPSGLVNNIAEAFEFARQLGLDPVTTTTRDDGDEIPTVRSPIRIGGSDDARGTAMAPPRLGEHNAAIRDWLTDGLATVRR